MQRRDNPAVRILGATALTLLIVVTRLPRELLLGLALFLWAYCSWSAWSRRDRLAEQSWYLFLLCLLSFLLFAAQSVLTACMVEIVGLVGQVRCLSPSRTGSPRRLTAGIASTFLVLTGYTHSPAVLLTAVVLFIVMTAIRREGEAAIGPFWLSTLVVLIGAITPAQPGLSLFMEIRTFLHSRGRCHPGFDARDPPVAGPALDRVRASPGKGWVAGRGWKYAIPLALFCVLEQGVSTTSFDKHEARARVNAIESAVEAAGNPRTFFYSSHRDGLPDWNDHVDAMWAGIALHLPTINGYSGFSPPGWNPLYESAVRNQYEESSVRRHLRDWIRRSGLRPDEVAWIHDGRRLRIAGRTRRSPGRARVSFRRGAARKPGHFAMRPRAPEIRRSHWNAGPGSTLLVWTW